MADSGDHAQIASDESTESAMTELAAELSTTRTDQHELTFLSPKTLMPPPVKTLISSRLVLHHTMLQHLLIGAV